MDEQSQGSGGDESSLDAISSLDALRAHIGDCHRCPLGDTRTTLVFGVGDPSARLMFVGEAPGRNEDLKGEPFVGAAGALLDELLASIGLVRSEVYIANVLKCRPPGNRDPLSDEMKSCTPFLAQQVRLIDPTVIATLGNWATKYMLGTERGITGLRGRLFRVGGRQIVPIFHPAAALYDQTKREVLFEDFKRLQSVLDGSLASAQAALPATHVPGAWRTAVGGESAIPDGGSGASAADDDDVQQTLF